MTKAFLAVHGNSAAASAGVRDKVHALTQAVVTSGRVRMTGAADADAVLEGQIVEYSLLALSFDRTANVTQYRLRLGLALTLRDLKKNTVIWKQDRIEERADFQVAGQVTTTLARENDAVKRAVTAAEAAGNGSVRHLVVDMEAVTDVDVTGAESFDALLAWLGQRGVELAFSRVRPDARRRLVELGLLGDREVFETNRAAIGALASPAP